MTGLVLDASFALTLVLPDEAHPKTAEHLAVVGAMRPVWVPALWRLETVNSLLMAERRGRFAPEEVRSMLELLESLRARVDPYTARRAAGRTLEVARRHRLTLYDATYLELAVRRGLALASFDKAMIRAARAEGVAVLG